MSNPTNDGGPAFPSPGIPGATDERNVQRDGMTLRDWFAGQALVGIAAHPALNRTPEAAARLSYETADAMLVERAKGPTQ